MAFTQEGWQRLLDLLEERTGAAYDDLWTAWVVNTNEAPLLVQRATVRDQYAEVIEVAGDWELPEQIRYELSSWQFADVSAELETADRVLDLAADLNALASELDLDPPDQLQAIFEGGDGLDAALTEANKELFALELIADASRGLATEPEPLNWIGLLFAEPAVTLAEARDAWEEGDHGTATDQAEAVLTTLDEADDRGRERVAIGAGILLVGVGGVALMVRRRRKGDRRARARARATRGSAARSRAL